MQDIHFEQKKRQAIAIAGETGSGKSTLLKIIGGLIQPDTGTVLFKKERVKGPNEQLIPGHPDMAYLSQHFELRNHYRVEEELDYVNQLSTKAANQLFELCEVKHLLKRWTTELSGGERQRVSLTRSLLSSPSLLLLDEPYSNLDLQHKQVLKKVIDDVSKKLHITILMVSHDAGDILPWAEKILILKNGRIVEEGSPQQLYSQPTLLYTAALLGKYNILPDNIFSLPTENKNNVTTIIRPEHCLLSAKATRKSIECYVTNSYYYGPVCEVLVSINNHLITVRTTESNLYTKGQKVYLTVLPSGIRHVTSE